MPRARNIAHRAAEKRRRMVIAIATITVIAVIMGLAASLIPSN